MWLKIEMSQIHSSYDTYYQPINKKDKTLKSVLELLENELEAQFINNEEKLIGIKFNIEIVDTIPEDVEIEDY